MTSLAELLTPEEELKRKAAAFEVSVANFEAERQRLSDLLAIDCKRLSWELDAETDRVWAGARGELRQIVADLMQIPVNLPRPEEAFQPRREPYWVAPAPAVSLLDLSAGAAARLLPRTLRDRRARSSRRGGREGRAAQRRQPRLGVAPEHRGFVSSLRDFAVRTTGSGAAGHPSGAAIGAAPSRRAVRGRRGRSRTGGPLRDGTLEHSRRASGERTRASRRRRL